MTTRRVIMRTGGGVAIALLLATCSIWVAQPQAGISATAAGAPKLGLPADATDVRWYLAGAFQPNTTYDFATSRASFDQWAKAYDVRPLVGPRHGSSLVLAYDPATRTCAFQLIDEAIAYEWSEQDRGVSLVFDRQSSRAYYNSHSR